MCSIDWYRMISWYLLCVKCECFSDLIDDLHISSFYQFFIPSQLPSSEVLTVGSWIKKCRQLVVPLQILLLQIQGVLYRLYLHYLHQGHLWKCPPIIWYYWRAAVFQEHWCSSHASKWASKQRQSKSLIGGLVYKAREPTASHAHVKVACVLSARVKGVKIKISVIHIDDLLCCCDLLCWFSCQWPLSQGASVTPYGDSEQASQRRSWVPYLWSSLHSSQTVLRFWRFLVSHLCASLFISIHLCSSLSIHIYPSQLFSSINLYSSQLFSSLTSWCGVLSVPSVCQVRACCNCWNLRQGDVVQRNLSFSTTSASCTPQQNDILIFIYVPTNAKAITNTNANARCQC